MERVEEAMSELVTGVKYTQFRCRVIFTIRNLADREMQLKKWVKDYRDDAYWWSLSLAIDVLFNDLNIEEKPETLVGPILRDEGELKALLSVAHILDRIMEETGYQKSDKEYIESPLFDELISTSNAAFKVFMANEVGNKELEDFLVRAYGSIWPK